MSENPRPTRKKIHIELDAAAEQYFRSEGARKMMGIHRQQYHQLRTLLEDNAPSPAHIPCVVVAEEDENHDEFYTVQVMTVPNQSGSFVTETIRTGYALHSFFLERVGALNMAGDFEEIEGIGENLSRKHYNVYINAEQHASICSLGTTEQL